mgnify:CR=1 FL=1
MMRSRIARNTRGDWTFVKKSAMSAGGTVSFPRLSFAKALTDKHADTVRDGLIECGLELRSIWRCHGDNGREFLGAFEKWLRNQSLTR